MVRSADWNIVMKQPDAIVLVRRKQHTASYADVLPDPRLSPNTLNTTAPLRERGYMKRVQHGPRQAPSQCRPPTGASGEEPAPARGRRLPIRSRFRLGSGAVFTSACFRGCYRQPWTFPELLPYCMLSRRWKAQPQATEDAMPQSPSQQNSDIAMESMSPLSDIVNNILQNKDIASRLYASFAAATSLVTASI